MGSKITMSLNVVLQLGKVVSEQKLIKANALTKHEYLLNFLQKYSNESKESLMFINKKTGDGTIGCGAILVLLKEGKIKTDLELAGMSTLDQRQALMMDLATKTNNKLEELSKYSVQDLVDLAIEKGNYKL